MALDTEKIDGEIIKESERFLKERGYDDFQRVNFVEFSGYCSREDFSKGDEINQIEIKGMRFNQAYGVTKDGTCVYATIID